MNIVSLKGALNFARRSLNCKEHTELLAINAQTLSRLKTLSHVDAISTATERVENKVTIFEPVEATTSLTKVGELNIVTVEVTTQNTPKVVYHDDMIKFQATAVLNINGEIAPRRSGMTLSVSTFILRGPQQCQAFTFGTSEQDSSNSWTIRIKPQHYGYHQECMNQSMEL